MSFRDGPFESIKVPALWTAALVAGACVAAALVLLMNDRKERLGAEGYAVARSGFDNVVGRSNSVLAAPVRWLGQGSDWIGDYFNAVEENRRLKRKLAELEAVRDNAIALQNINRRYEALLNIRFQPPIAMATARAVSESRGPFANSRLIDAGARQGVRLGNPVINEHGLIGRVVGVSGSISRVLLLTDVASRTPVLVDRTDARAILSGDGGSNPKLDYLRGKDAVREGDLILTSGDGGMIPRGLPVGKAARALDGSWRVKLLSERGGIDFVRVLLFQDFSQLLRPGELDTPPLASLSTAPAPSQDLAARIEAVHPTRRAAATAATPRSAPSTAPATAPQGSPPTRAAPETRPAQ